MIIHTEWERVYYGKELPSLWMWHHTTKWQNGQRSSRLCQRRHDRLCGNTLMLHMKSRLTVSIVHSYSSDSKSLPFIWSIIWFIWPMSSCEILKIIKRYQVSKWVQALTSFNWPVLGWRSETDEIAASDQIITPSSGQSPVRPPVLALCLNYSNGFAIWCSGSVCDPAPTVPMSDSLQP